MVMDKIIDYYQGSRKFECFDIRLWFNVKNDVNVSGFYLVLVFKNYCSNLCGKVKI
jgi:hypothetical protein